MPDPKAPDDLNAHAVSQATDNAAVEARITGSLAAFNAANGPAGPSSEPSKPPEPKGSGGGEPKPEDEGKPKEPDPKPEDTAATDGKTPPVEPKEPEEVVDDDGDDDSTPTLPAAYRRTAKRSGWTDEEIDDFAKASYDGAIKTFSKMHDSVNAMSSEWANLGRKKKADEEAAASGSQPAAAPPVRTEESGLSALDEKALLEKYGEDHADLIRDLVGPVNQVIERLKPIAEQAQASQAFIADTEEQAMGRQIQEFFTAKDMKSFYDYYGTDYDSINDEQLKHRNEVLELADAIIVGAQVQGRRLPPDDAMLLAHDSTTAKMQEDRIRENLKKKAKDRGQGISLTPSHQGRQAAPHAGPAKDDAELLARAEASLKKTFG